MDNIDNMNTVSASFMDHNTKVASVVLMDRNVNVVFVILAKSKIMLWTLILTLHISQIS